MTLVKKIALCLAILVAALAVSPVTAQDKKVTETTAHAAPATTIFGTAFGAGIGAGLVIIGAAMGFGRIGGSALESMARQPETAARVQTAMIIIGALLEGATFFALIICIQLAVKA
jgi:F-type H+-transporting ATPase subunit c